MSSTVCNDLDDVKAAKAVKALLKFEAKRITERNETKLMDGNAKPILIQFQLKKPMKNSVIRPVRVKIPNSMFDPDGEDHSVCLFCRSADKAMIESALEDKPIDGVTTVVSIDQVKKNFKAFKERKDLFSKHSHFICDNRIFSHLINLLGKVFSRRNNHPIPIDITNMAKFESNVLKSIHNSTYLHLSGQTLSVRMGLTSMEANEVVANVQEGVRTAVDKIGCGWGGILAIYIKSNDSPALPLHNSYANEMGDFVNAKMAKSEKKTKEATPAKKTKTAPQAAVAAIPKIKTKKPVEAATATEATPVATPLSNKKPSPRATRSVVKKRALAAEEQAQAVKKPKSSVKAARK